MKNEIIFLKMKSSLMTRMNLINMSMRRSMRRNTSKNMMKNMKMKSRKKTVKNPSRLSLFPKRKKFQRDSKQ